METRKSVAVIGAGSSGLTAIKACKEEGIDVMCFEKSEGIGGLWNYTEKNEKSPSIMNFTIVNTQKEMNAFSDFPPPSNFPNYMHHSQLMQYFHLYAKRFGLLSHICFNHEVLNVERSHDYDVSGQWKMTFRSLLDHKVKEKIFDGVMVCSGHHAQPTLPCIPGLDRFRGTVLHSQSLKVVDYFKDLNVLVVGIGNSGVDAATEISSIAKQVYISTRRGSWISPRCGPYGLPADTLFACRFVQYALRVLGWKAISTVAETLVLNQYFNHSLYGLKPKHRYLSQHPTISDAFPSKVLSGRILVKNNIEYFTDEGVAFEKENDVIPIDAVIFATGYNIEFPFISEGFLKPINNKVEVYKLTFPPVLKHPSLAVIGFIQPLGPIFPIAEAQSRWFAHLMNGNGRLPSLDTMKKEIRERRKATQKRYVDSPRHTIQVDFTSFMDDITSEFGAAPNMLKMMFMDPVLFLVCLIGPCLPYQYRLHGPHSSLNAREIILSYPSRVVLPMKNGLTRQHYSYFEFFRIFNLVPLLYVLPLVILNIFLFIFIFFIR